MVETSVRKRLWSSHPVSHPSCVNFSRHGTPLAVKSTTGRIAILDVESSATIVDFANQRDGEGAEAIFSPCGKYLVDAPGPDT
jgi:hypothetical protein